jgi:hypothetical protein
MSNLQLGLPHQCPALSELNQTINLRTLIPNYRLDQTGNVQHPCMQFWSSSINYLAPLPSLPRALPAGSLQQNFASSTRPLFGLPAIV